MQKSKFIAMLLAVAMVVSMVVVPAAANGEPYTITLTANSIAAAPGGTISLTLSTAGTIPDPGVTAVGAVIKYPAGWTLTGVDDSAATALFSGINLLPSHNDDGAGTYTMYWGMDAFTTAVGDLATLTFTIPSDAALADYPFTVENGEELNVTGTLDGEGKLIVGSLTDVEVAFAGCSVTVGSACPLHTDAEYTAVDATVAETWAAGGDLATGHYRLETDVTLNDRLKVTGTVCIDLNGHNITVADGVTSRVFYISGGSLNITDGVGTGVISGGSQTDAATPYGGNIYNDGGNFRLYGGTISGGKVSNATASKAACGGNIYGNAASKIFIYGGEVKDGVVDRDTYNLTSATVLSGGGNIYSLGPVTIKNAKVTGGTVTSDFSGSLSATAWSQVDGGNIFAGGALTIEDSTISGGTITKNHENTHASAAAASRVFGGNIYATGVTVTIKNSTISDGSCNLTISGKGKVYAQPQGGNIYITKGNLTISDNSTVSGGTVTYNASTSSTTAANKLTTTKNALNYVSPHGGSILVETSTVTITDSTISGGSVARAAGATTAKVGKGGNIFVANLSTLNIENGSVLDGSVGYRGGNLVTKGASGKVATVNLSGTTNINYGTAALAATSALYSMDYSTINMSGEATLSRSRIDANTTMNMYGGYISQIYILDGVTFTMYGGRIGTLEGTAGATINNGYVTKISATGTIDSPACAHVNVIGTDGKRVWHNEGTCSVCGHNYVADGDTTACATCGVVHEAWHGVHTFDSEGNCTVDGCTKTLVAHDDSCNCGGETVSWTAWDGNTVDGGHYYLTDNLDIFDAQINGACLDLNGYTLTVLGGFDASIDGNVIDTAGTGKLVDTAPVFNPSNSMLPIYVDNGYVFEAPVFNQTLTHTDGEAKGKFGFYLENPAASTCMDEALKEGRITIQVNVTWDGGQMTCALDSSMRALATYADNWDTKMLVLNLTGLTDITGLTCTAQVYANGVTVQ